MRIRFSALMTMASLVAMIMIASGCPAPIDVEAEKAEKAAAAEEAGTEAFESGDFDEAIAQLEEAADAAPGDPEIHRKLGLGYEARGRLDEALAQYNESLDENPEQAEVLYKAAIIRKTQGDTAGAIEGLNRALVVNQEFVAARLILGELYTAQGETDKAKAEYQAVIDLNPFGGAVETAQTKLAEL